MALKIEANANKYSFVWNKSVRNYDRKLDEKIKNHLREIDRIVAEENQIYLEEDLEEKGEHTQITAEQVAAVVESIDKKLEQEPGNKQLKKKSKEFKRISFPGNRNTKNHGNLSWKGTAIQKQTRGATFMRMKKEDAMLNGQLKPGYNIQIGTENRYIVGFTIHPNPTDTKTMIPHLRHLEENWGCLPENVIADAGYGSEENYEYLEEKEGRLLCKNTTNFTGRRKRKTGRTLIWRRICPICRNQTALSAEMGKRLVHVGNRKYVTEAGYETRQDYYRCEDCSGCHYASECKHTEKNRTVRVSHRLNELKKKKQTRTFVRKRTGTAFTKGCGSGTGLWEDQRLLVVPSFSLARSR